MDRIINVKVGGNYISKDNKTAGVRGEANVTKLRLTFDGGWDDFAKTVTFFDAYGNNPVKRIETVDLLEDITKDTRTYITPIPKEAMAVAGELTFVIDGFYGKFVKNDAGEYEVVYEGTSKRQRSISDTLVVKYAPIADDAEKPTDPTPTPPEQWQMQVDNLIGEIQGAVIARNETKVYRDEAEGLAHQILKDATSAEENANKAVAKANEAELSARRAEGAVGKTSYIGENGNWYAWDEDESDFYDTGIRAQSGSVVYCGDTPPDEADVWINPDGDDTPIIIDTEMSDTSENPVQNKAAKKYVDDNIPTKISDLEDDTSIGAGTAIQWSNNALTAESAIYDGEWNSIATTYAKKPIIIYWNEPILPFEFANRHNNVIRAGELTSISFTFGNGVYTEDYIADISFDSGETPTALDYTGSGILNWVGVGCVVNDGLSIFQPSANTHYDIIFYFNGTQFIGMVNGFVPSTGNVVSE